MYLLIKKKVKLRSPRCRGPGAPVPVHKSATLGGPTKSRGLLLVQSSWCQICLSTLFFCMCVNSFLIAYSLVRSHHTREAKVNTGITTAVYNQCNTCSFRPQVFPKVGSHIQRDAHAFLILVSTLYSCFVSRMTPKYFTFPDKCSSSANSSGFINDQTK